MIRLKGLCWCLGLALLLGFACSLFGQTQNLPPKPPTYLTDEAHVVDPATAQAINDQLEQFERDTSNQILVAIYPSLPANTEVAQYCIDLSNAWKAGQKGKDNGAILFVFIQDHRMFITTGRGLEGALPDATCKNIISQVITPAFKQGDYAGGIQAGVNAMVAATKGEYTGTGQTHDDQEQQIPAWVVIVIIILFLVLRLFIFPRIGGGPFIYTGGGFGSGGFGGGGGGGGGGGFSGGGGSFAGGGAGGSW